MIYVPNWSDMKKIIIIIVNYENDDASIIYMHLCLIIIKYDST